MYTAILQFQLDSVHNTLARALMRFAKPEIDIILLLFWFDRIKYCARFQATLEEALGVVLLRLAWPVQYLSLMDQFGHSRTWLCIVYVDTCKYLARRYQSLLAWDDKRLHYDTLRGYADAIQTFGGGPCFWGWINGTIQDTCRPGDPLRGEGRLNQKDFYSGHKRKHGFKFQGVVTPDGLISSSMGPFIGKDSDWKMVEDSGLTHHLRELNTHVPLDQHFYLYGDPAYSCVWGIMGPYKKQSNV